MDIPAAKTINGLFTVAHIKKAPPRGQTLGCHRFHITPLQPAGILKLINQIVIKSRRQAEIDFLYRDPVIFKKAGRLFIQLLQKQQVVFCRLTIKPFFDLIENMDIRIKQAGCFLIA